MQTLPQLYVKVCIYADMWWCNEEVRMSTCTDVWLCWYQLCSRSLLNTTDTVRPIPPSVLKASGVQLLCLTYRSHNCSCVHTSKYWHTVFQAYCARQIRYSVFHGTTFSQILWIRQHSRILLQKFTLSKQPLQRHGILKICHLAYSQIFAPWKFRAIRYI